MAIKRGDAWLVDRGRRRLAPSCLSQCHSRRPVFLARPVTVDRPLSSPTRRYARIYESYPSLSLSRAFSVPPSPRIITRGRRERVPFVIAELYLGRWLIRTIGTAVRGSGSAEERGGGDGYQRSGLGLASRPCLSVAPSSFKRIVMDGAARSNAPSNHPLSRDEGREKETSSSSSLLLLENRLFSCSSLPLHSLSLFCSSVPKHRHKKHRASVLKTEGMPTSRRIRTNFADRQRRAIRVHQHLFPGAERDHRLPASL